MTRPDHSDDTRQYNDTKREEFMRPGSICAVLAASVLGSMLSVADVGAQTRALPRFEVDAGWLKVPPQFRVGDVSSFAVNAQDEVFLLHRPRTLKPDQAAMAAPPVMVFDPSGNYLRSWGGAGQGYEWIEREHGIHIDYKGFVWIGGNNCPASNLPGLKPVADDQLLKFTQDGKFVLQIGKSNQSKGNADTANVHRAADGWVNPTTNELFVADGYGNHRVIVFDADTGAFKRMWGAFSNKPGQGRLRDPAPHEFLRSRPGSIQHRAWPSGCQRRHGLCGGPRVSPRADVLFGRQIHQAVGQARHVVRT